MDRLSSDVLQLIVDCLASDRKLKLSQYATISRPWQSAIERHTFKKIYVSSFDVQRFREIFAKRNQTRSAFVRWLNFETAIPLGGHTLADHREDTLSLGKALVELFTELAHWNNRKGGTHEHSANGNGSLYLEFGYRRYRPSGSKAADLRCQSFTIPIEVLRELPRNSCVTKFTTSAVQGFAFSPMTTSYLASRMSSLEDFKFMYIDAPNHRTDLRTARHDALRDGIRLLRDVQPQSLSKLTLERSHRQEPRNHDFVCQDFTNKTGVDELCEAIRNFVQVANVRELELIGLPITLDLVRQRSHGSAMTQPPSLPQSALWPSIESLSINSGIVGADGKWLFTGNSDTSPYVEESPSESSDSDGEESLNGSGDDDSKPDHSELYNHDMGTDEQNGLKPKHKWRRIPDPKVFNHLITGLSKAVTLMPRLQSFDFFVNAEHPEDGITIQAVGPDRQYKVPYMDKIKPFTTGALFPHRRVKCWVGVDTEWGTRDEVLRVWRDWAGDNGTVKTAIYSVN